MTSPKPISISINPIPHNLVSLQAGRAIAAAAVILYHNSLIFSLYWGTSPFGHFFDFGDSGVLFFFVLSGFIILHAHYGDLDNPRRVRPYLWKRIRRLYPFYWLVLLAVLPIYFMVERFGQQYNRDPLVILSSFLLVHVGQLDAVNGVSWTLFHEILFYVLFALAIWNVRLGLAVIGCWIGLSAASMVTKSHPLFIGFYFSYLHVMFGLGMGAVWVLRRVILPLPAAIAVIGLIIFAVAGCDENWWNNIADDWRSLLFGFGATLMVLGVVELERRRSLRIPKVLKFLGDASYSIYLVHYYILSILAKVISKGNVSAFLPEQIIYVLMFVLALCGGALCHVAVEKPLLRLLSGYNYEGRVFQQRLR